MVNFDGSLKRETCKRENWAIHWLSKKDSDKHTGDEDKIMVTESDYVFLFMLLGK